jgi:hypothetical protein
MEGVPISRSSFSDLSRRTAAPGLMCDDSTFSATIQQPQHGLYI